MISLGPIKWGGRVPSVNLRPQPRGGRHSIQCTALLLAVIGLILVDGCGKKASTAAMPSPSTNAEAAAAAAGQPDLAELDRSLLRWLVGHRRPPKNFEEFATTSGANIPPPPVGKKYVITKKMHIELVDR
jgi:hypothetical protein